MALAETAKLAVELSLKGDFARKLGAAGGALGKFQGSITRTGRGMGQLGAGLLRVGTVGAVAAAGGLTAVAKAAIDFEDAFAGVKKTVDEADLAAAGLSFEKLERQFRDLATTIPVAATELARIGETAGALGIDAGSITKFTEVVAKLGVTTDLTSDAAAEALGKVGTILDLTAGDFEHFGDVLVNLGNQGASTESEIIEVTKRFAAMGKQAGLTTEQILALASSATSLGAEPEAAGSALSRIFANMSTEIANATEKGQAFADITGSSLDELKKRVDKGEALPILLETLEGLSDLSRTESASVLKALGINNVRDRDAILKMAQNLDFVNEQLAIAGDSTGALGAEAAKRFDTVASKIALFRNNVTDAAITIGEGFAPAIGRAAEKLSAFLRQSENQQALKRLGEDIGAFIDDIDWDSVLDGAKSMVSILKEAGGLAVTVVGALSKLPKEVLALGAVAIGANKLSGGLLGAGIGNVFGGLAEALAKGLAANIPVFGKAFVQPVFVTNPGFGGGVPGVPGGGGGASAIRTIGQVVLPVAAGILIANAIREVAGISPEESARIQNGQRNPRRNAPPNTAAGNALTNVGRNVSAPIVAKLGDTNSEIRLLQMDVQRLQQASTMAVMRSEAASSRGAAQVAAQVARVPPAVAHSAAVLAGTTRSEAAGIRAAQNANAAATRLGAAMTGVKLTNLGSRMQGIVGAVRAIRPQVNVRVSTNTYLNSRRLAYALGVTRTGTTGQTYTIR